MPVWREKVPIRGGRTAGHRLTRPVLALSNAWARWTGSAPSGCVVGFRPMYPPSFSVVPRRRTGPHLGGVPTLSPRAGKEFLVGAGRASPGQHPPKTVGQGKINSKLSCNPINCPRDRMRPWPLGRGRAHALCLATVGAGLRPAPTSWRRTGPHLGRVPTCSPRA